MSATVTLPISSSSFAARLRTVIRCSAVIALSCDSVVLSFYCWLSLFSFATGRVKRRGPISPETTALRLDL